MESADQLMACAEAVKSSGAHILRGGLFKPRTSPPLIPGTGLGRPATHGRSPEALRLAHRNRSHDPHPGGAHRPDG
ncbi:hypothetical protein ACFL5M_07195 [Candidatus Neomarinimicrobiota bacterium]